MQIDLDENPVVSKPETSKEYEHRKALSKQEPNRVLEPGSPLEHEQEGVVPYLAE